MTPDCAGVKRMTLRRQLVQLGVLLRLDKRASHWKPGAIKFLGLGTSANGQLEPQPTFLSLFRNCCPLSSDLVRGQFAVYPQKCSDGKANCPRTRSDDSGQQFRNNDKNVG